MHEMFGGCKSLTSLDLRGWDTSNVEVMAAMFMGCTSLTSLDLRSFDTRKVSDMSNMFNGCSRLSSIIVGNFWKEPSYIGGMFENCGVSSVTRQ